MFNFEVQQGAVVINSVDSVIDHDDVKIIEVDLSSKYPGVPWHGRSSGGEISVYIPAETYTLEQNPAYGTEDAEIRFKVPDAWDWSVITDGTRRTVRVALVPAPGYGGLRANLSQDHGGTLPQVP